MDPTLLQSGLLAQALPVLLHKLANQTQLITGFHAILKMDGGEALVEARSPDLAAAGQHVEQVGWLLAALSSGAGHNLMLARREPRGLIWMVDLVHETLRKSGVEAAGFGQPLPHMTPRAPEGWRLPWVLACMLFEAYQDGTRSHLAWSLEPSAGGEWTLRIPGMGDVQELLGQLASHLDEARWQVGADGMGELSMPGPWVEMGE